MEIEKRTITITDYICEKCSSAFDTEEECKDGESLEVTHDKKVKVGDKIKVLQGEGVGETAIVEDISIHPCSDKGRGRQYRHTMVITARMVESYGHRILFHDQYEKRESR